VTAPAVTVTVTATATVTKAPPTSDATDVLATCRGAVVTANEGFNRAGEGFGIVGEMNQAIADQDLDAWTEARDRFRVQTDEVIAVRQTFDALAATCVED